MCMCMMDHNHNVQHQPGAMADPAGATRLCHCGYPLQPGFAFCPNCGMSLRTSSCPSCGREMDATWKACPYCGTEPGAHVSVTTGHAHHQ